MLKKPLSRPKSAFLALLCVAVAAVIMFSAGRSSAPQQIHLVEYRSPSYEPEVSTVDADKGYLATFLTPFYGEDYSSYTILDAEGGDVTEAFFEATQPLYSLEDWGGIKDVYKEMGISGMHKTTEY